MWVEFRCYRRGIVEAVVPQEWEKEMGPKRARTIGRSRECDLVIRSSRVSRVHCRVTDRGDSWLIRDLDSRNGLWVDGERVASALLKVGDRFIVGDHSVRLGEGGALTLEGISDPKVVPVARRISREIPAVSAVALPLAIILVLLVMWKDPPPPEPSGTGPEIASVELPIPRWQPPQQATEEAESASSFSTSTGRQYTIEELLAIAEQVELDRRRDTADDTSVRTAPPLEEMWDDLVGIETIEPLPGEEAPVVANKVGEGDNVEPQPPVGETLSDPLAAPPGRERRPRRRSTGPTSRPAAGPTSRPAVTRVPRATGSSVLILAQEGEAIVERYHEPGFAVDELLPIFDELIDHGSVAAADAFLAIRGRALQHVERLASRVRILSGRYSPYIADLSRLSEAKRREVELGMRLLEMLRGQLQELVEVRDAIDARVLDCNYPVFLRRAIEVAFEKKNSDLTDRAIEALRRDRCLEALPALIEHASHSSAKRRKQINDVLREVTGEHYNNRKEWKQWWQDLRKDGQG